MPSRFLLFTTDYPPMRGGIARLLGAVVDLSPPDVQWRCVTLAAGPAEAGVHRFRSFASLCRSVPEHMRWLRAVPAADRYVVAGHAYLQPPALAARVAARARLTTMVYGTEIIPKRLPHWGALSLLRLSDCVIADSHYAADVTATALGVSRRRLRVVHPTFRSPYLVERPPAPRPSGLPVRLVTVSRLADVHKNLEVAVRAVSVLAGTGVVDAYTLVGDGPQRPRLEALVRTLGVEHLVEFAGALDDEPTAKVLADSHLGLFPSRRVDNFFEGFGLAVHELAGAGLPVLVGRSGGTPDAAAGEWAILLDPDDVGAWVRAIEELAGDEERRASLARQAWDWASRIDAGATARTYVDAIRGA